MKKLVVYFYLTNNIDNKPWPEIQYTSQDVDYYMFTDDRKHVPDKNWNVVYVDAEDDFYSKEDMNKKIKWNPFKYFEGKYEYSLYCDSKIMLVGNPIDCLKEYKDKLKVGFTCHRYGYIKNSKYENNVKDVYRHADYLLDVNVGHLDNIRRLKTLYKERGLPLNSGVVETAVILTNLNSKKAKEIQTEIFNEYIERNTKRDQLIVPYVLWKNNINVSDVELFGNFEDNKKNGRYFKVSSKTNVNNRDYSSDKYRDKRNIIVTMTSWKKRINNCVRIIDDIENNSLVPDKIYLNLSVEEFPNKEKDLPNELVKQMSKYENFIINWVEGKNTKSIKKVFPILKFLDDSDIIINTDDDIIIPKDFIKSRVSDYMKYNSPITGGTTKQCRGVVFREVCGIDYMKTATACCLYTKRMLRGYDLLMNDDIIRYFNDDMIYSALVYLNGYNFVPCSDYSIWADWDWTKNKLKFFNDFDGLSQSEEIKNNYYENSKKVIRNIRETIKNIKNHPFNKERYINFTRDFIKGIISITSYPKRINVLPKVLNNLKDKIGEDYKIVLTLSETEFSNREKDFTEELISAIKRNNVEIVWVKKNYNVFKKVLFTMNKYPEYPIISADDDCLYKINYADMLYSKWCNKPNSVISMGPQIKYSLYGKDFYFPHGCCTLYPPASLLPLLKYVDNEKIIGTKNDDSFYGIFLTNSNIEFIYLNYKLSDFIDFVNTGDALTAGIKGQKDFINDKNIIINELSCVNKNNKNTDGKTKLFNVSPERDDAPIYITDSKPVKKQTIIRHTDTITKIKKRPPVKKLRTFIQRYDRLY